MQLDPWMWVAFGTFVVAMLAVDLVAFGRRGEEIPFRRAYIRSVIDRVDVDDAEIRIFGRKTMLERLVVELCSR